MQQLSSYGQNLLFESFTFKQFVRYVSSVNEYVCRAHEVHSLFLMNGHQLRQAACKRLTRTYLYQLVCPRSGPEDAGVHSAKNQWQARPGLQAI